MPYIEAANSLPLYLIVGGILLFIALLCVLFIVRSYRAGIKIGMDRRVLRRAITSSATFTVLPSVSILLGVIALSGSLGIPASWLRLSVIGNLQYEATVAEIAANSMGLSLNSSSLDVSALSTILLVMTVGIIWGCLLSIFTMKKYSSKLAIGRKSNTSSGGYASWAMVAMMIGLCSTFVGSYIAEAFVSVNLVPVITVIVASLFMALFELVGRRHKVFENFSLALSMLLAMIGAVVVSMFV